MKQKSLLFIFSVGLLFITKAQSPQFAWAKQFNRSKSNCLALDASGNLIVTGTFTGTIDLDPSPSTYTLNSSNGDRFVCKLDSSGDFIWARQLPNVYLGSTSLSLDVYNNVYVAGDFKFTADFDPGPGSHTLSSNGNEDIFILKLNSSGNFVWVKQIGGSQVDGVRSIDVTPSGIVYLGGRFEGSGVDLDPGPGILSLTANGSADLFILRLDTVGNFVWAKQISGTGNEGNSSDLICDKDDNVYMSGDFYSGIIVDCDPGASTFTMTTPNSTISSFIIKLNAAGNFQWAKQIGGPVGTGLTYINNMAVDGSGNIYSAGYFDDSTDLDPGPGVSTFTTNSLSYFLLKLNGSGNFVWARQVTSDNSGSKLSITLDNNGSIYGVGTFQNTVDFDPGPGTFNLTSKGNLDAFVFKYNSLGNFVWAGQIGGVSTDFGRDVAFRNQNIFSVGEFLGKADFDCGVDSFYLYSNPSWTNDMFIHKMCENCVIGIDEYEQTDYTVNVFPNPTKDRIRFFLNDQETTVHLRIRSTIGAIILEKELDPQNSEIDIEGLAPGLYVIELGQGDNLFRKKVIKN